MGKVHCLGLFLVSDKLPDSAGHRATQLTVTSVPLSPVNLAMVSRAAAQDSVRTSSLGPLQGKMPQDSPEPHGWGGQGRQAGGQSQVPLLGNGGGDTERLNPPSPCKRQGPPQPPGVPSAGPCLAHTDSADTPKGKGSEPLGQDAKPQPVQVWRTSQPSDHHGAHPRGPVAESAWVLKVCALLSEMSWETKGQGMGDFPSFTTCP